MLRFCFGKLYFEVLGSFMWRFCFGKLYVEVLFWEALC